MKNIYVLLPFVLLMLFPYYVNSQNEKVMNMVDNIQWFGQSAVKITATDKIIYIDPYKIKDTDEADIVLITHKHNDHCSVEDFNKIAGSKTIVIATDDCFDKLGNISVAKKISLLPQQETEIDGIKITAVPAYNINKTNFHPKENNWVGYVITIDGVKIYHAGDTERIPEMKDMDCDIAMLPLGQTYTMDSVEDAEKFKALLEGKIKVIIKSSN